MKRLILMRHAKTEPWTEGIDDHGRALTARGHKAAEVVAGVLAEAGWAPSHALVSTARRTRETWNYVFERFPKCEPTILEGVYLAGSHELQDYVGRYNHAETLIVIGHNPGLHDLAIILARQGGTIDHSASLALAAKFPTGGAALFEAKEDVKFHQSAFQLTRFIRPRDIAAMEH